MRCFAALLLACSPLLAQDADAAGGKKAPAAAPLRFATFPVPDGAPLVPADASRLAVQALLQLQQGDAGGEWPYQGVYREDDNPSPLGYRVGGTAIACLGLLAAPGYRTDEGRQAALRRGLEFVLSALELDRMQVDFVGRYDVRGWGHIYALQFLLHLQDGNLVPKDLVERVGAKTTWLVKALAESAIPGAGGWNYSRPAGYSSPKNEASTFMTAPALQALFHAGARGHTLPNKVIDEALAALERARAKPGGYAYGAPNKAQAEVDESALSMMEKTPSSAARAAVIETTLHLAGRGDPVRLQRAVELFFRHWDDLAVRKSQKGTHVPPYGIAPYYFLFGHVYAAQAIEFLPDPKRIDELRAKMLVVLAKSREVDGSWNDRIAARSGGYGTGLALLTMNMPRLPKPAPWTRPAPTKGDAGK